jgi:histone deacetylase 1/2
MPRFSVESEYHSMAAITSELILLQGLLADLSLPYSHLMLLQYDNQSTLHLAVNPVFHVRTKHIEIGFHFIHEHL